MIANRTGQKGKQNKGNVLLHIIGLEAVKVYNGFTWAPGQWGTPGEDKENLDGILRKFEEYCTLCKNTIYE